LDQQREPPFRGPWPVWTIVVLILLSYLAQSRLMPLNMAAALYGLSPVLFWQGRWGTAVSALFIHGGWAHAGMNAVGALAFGAPLSRKLGIGAKGAVGYFVFYVLCGVAANVAYAAVHPQALAPLVGASGAVSGLFGAASRLAGRSTRLAPFLSRQVVASTGSWVIINVIMGLMHYAPGIGEVQVGWEAHIAGFLVGLLLAGPICRVFEDASAPENRTAPPA
jgi:membrane associated rhomboid family serine protease